MKGQATCVLSRGSQKSQIQNMHRNVASPETELPIWTGPPSGFIRQIAVFDNVCSSVDGYHISNFLFAKSFLDDLSCHLRSGQQVIADQRRVTGSNERVVDLSIKEMLNAPLRSRLQNPLAIQRRDDSTVPIWTQRYS